MLQELYNREIYGQALALKIEAMGSITVAIANRWALGWPTQVQAMLTDQSYMANLAQQTETELDMVAEAVNMNHLTHSELLKANGIPEAPPMLG